MCRFKKNKSFFKISCLLKAHISFGCQSRDDNTLDIELRHINGNKSSSEVYIELNKW